MPPCMCASRVQAQASWEHNQSLHIDNGSLAAENAMLSSRRWKGDQAPIDDACCLRPCGLGITPLLRSMMRAACGAALVLSLWS